jgi:hypothetical protein
MATLVETLLLAFVLFSMGLAIDDCFERLNWATLILASLLGALLITACVHLWVEHQSPGSSPQKQAETSAKIRKYQKNKTKHP